MQHEFGNADGKRTIGGSYYGLDLDQSIALDDLIREIDVSERRLEMLKDSLRRSEYLSQRNLPSSSLRDRLSSSPPSVWGRVIEECPVSPVRVRKLEDALKVLEKRDRELDLSSENGIRRRIVTLLVTSFLTITLLSAGMTWFAATNPGGMNGQLVKDWTNTMVTAEVGFISAILGYYFGIVDRPRRAEDIKNDPPSDQTKD